LRLDKHYFIWNEKDLNNSVVCMIVQVLIIVIAREGR